MGRRGQALAAIGGAFRVFPARTLFHLVLKPRLAWGGAAVDPVRRVKGKLQGMIGR